MTGPELLATGAHEFVAVIGTAVTTRKGFLMFKDGFDIAKQACNVIGFVVGAVQATNSADGAAKKAAATAQIQAAIDKVIPAWAALIVNPLISILIEAAVAEGKQAGFLTSSGTSSATPSGAA